MNAYIEELQEQLRLAERAATPVTTEVIKSTKDEIVTVNSHGTMRTDLLGGEAPKYLPGHSPVAPATPTDLPPVSKEVGKVIKENEEERVVRLVGGTIRTDVKG